MIASIDIVLAMGFESETLSAYDYSDIQAIVNACESQGADCTVDASTFSGDGDRAFTSKCSGVGGKVYEYDVAYTCTDNGADKTIRVNNVKQCIASTCTDEDAKELTTTYTSLSSGSLTCTPKGAAAASTTLVNARELKLSRRASATCSTFCAP